MQAYSEADQETGFAHTGVPKQHKLEQVIAKHRSYRPYYSFLDMFS